MNAYRHHKFFGTDGVRGKANVYPITAEMALKIGQAVASLYKNKAGPCKVILGKDTRISGDMLENAVSAGICSMGVDACITGVLPTPGVAYLTAATDAVAGIVISASHNPFHDNGIKIFQKEGYKLSDQDEAELEALVSGNDLKRLSEAITMTGRSFFQADASQRYAAFLKKSFPDDFRLDHIHMVIDCAHGATSYIAADLLRSFGATVTAISMSPNGTNINQKCGSEYPRKLMSRVVAEKADLGLAFDGDGDRLLVVDETGNPATGDQILAVNAAVMQKEGLLRNNRVVSTVMSNLGLGVALKGMGIDHVIAGVGDRLVLAKMRETDAVLGGEDSGHMIFLDRHTTGDGLYAALKFLKAVLSESTPVSALLNDIPVFPQVLVNVTVKEKPALDRLKSVKAAIDAVVHRLAGRGRVLVRYSGTQPLCRVMVEGPKHEVTRTYAEEIAAAIKGEIGQQVSTR